jgi:hypothetical protein
MMRALTESIIPALDAKDSLVQEQAGLLLGHINALIQQNGLERQIDHQEATALTDLARELLASAEGGDNTVAAAQKLTAVLAEGSFEDISKAVERLLSMDDASPAFKDAAWKPVLEYSRNAAARGQQWFKPMGF